MNEIFWKMVMDVFVSTMNTYDESGDPHRTLEHAMRQAYLFCHGVRDVRLSDTAIVLVDKHGMGFVDPAVVPKAISGRAESEGWLR